MPVTMYFDGSARLVSTAEAVVDDQTVMEQTDGVDGLWSRGTPLGEVGYFGEFSFDGTITSYHIFTTDGITGRDFLSP